MTVHSPRRVCFCQPGRQAGPFSTRLSKSRTRPRRRHGWAARWAELPRFGSSAGSTECPACDCSNASSESSSLPVENTWSDPRSRYCSSCCLCGSGLCALQADQRSDDPLCLSFSLKVRGSSSRERACTSLGFCRSRSLSLREAIWPARAASTEGAYEWAVLHLLPAEAPPRPDPPSRERSAR